MGGLPRRQRVAAYAVVLRTSAEPGGATPTTSILLTRLARRITPDELWTLPGGGLDHGEDPRDAVRREIVEETGLDAEVGDRARVYSAHLPHAWRDGRRVDAHALRIVYEGWVAPDAPAPRVLERDGSTMDAAWVPVTRVLDGTVPVVPMVLDALADHGPAQRQRVAAYAVVVRDGAVLLTRNSVRGPHPGSWMLPGGGIDHGEDPRAAVVREVGEETGLTCEVGAILDVSSVHFEGTAPTGRQEDFHAVQLVYTATVTGSAGDGREPHPTEVGGTTDAAAWVALADVGSAAYPVRPLVSAALRAVGGRA
ncbi:NUDIX domain-containing protein [uncultured Nocardioides sp.]|uniref:NUDIX hydrolase n=1 Tax=uncultured Nocardioides sp. TaxID=198441 RepID=UPI0026334BCC|nr:NUDIX domain-containing protein [uncultured Nocardioides sp.]